MITILNNMLKVRNKYSLKRVIALITFLYVINLSAYTIFYEKPVGAIDSLLLFLTALLGLNTIDKKFTDQQSKVEEE